MGITPEDRSYSNSKNLFFGVFMRNKTYNKKKMLVVFLSALLMIFFLIARLVYLMIFSAEGKNVARKGEGDQGGKGRDH